MNAWAVAWLVSALLLGAAAVLLVVSWVMYNAGNPTGKTYVIVGGAGIVVLILAAVGFILGTILAIVRP